MPKTMYHFFRTDIAAQYGINAAVLLENIRYWVDKNEANRVHFHEGRYWTYNSVKAFVEMFPYLSEKQIRGALSKLEDEGLILKGNYNTSPYDRTAWYALTDKANALFDPSLSVNIDLPSRANQNAPEGEPIPDNKPDIYTPCVSNTGYKPNTDTLPNNTTNPIEKPVLDTRPPKGESGGGRSPIPYETVKSEYNAICKSLPECKALTEKRKREIKARFAEGFTLDTFSELFRKAEASSFCKGGGKTGWIANFDFLVGTRAIKVLEGAYDNDPTTNAPSCVRHELTDEEFDALFPLPGEKGEGNA